MFQLINLTNQLEFWSYLLFVQLIFIVIIPLKQSLLSLYVLWFGFFFIYTGPTIFHDCLINIKQKKILTNFFYRDKSILNTCFNNFKLNKYCFFSSFNRKHFCRISSSYLNSFFLKGRPNLQNLRFKYIRSIPTDNTQFVQRGKTVRKIRLVLNVGFQNIHKLLTIFMASTWRFFYYV